MSGSSENFIEAESVPRVIIRPHRGWTPINLSELWEYRELLYFLVWRDIKVRYKQSVIGIAWAVLQPALMMGAFTLFFGVLAKVSSNGIPYPLFSYAGLLPWTLFAAGITRASNVLIQDVNLIQKVYFPRLLLPLAGILAPLVDFAISLIVLVGLMLGYSYYPHLTILWLPLFLILELMLTLGIGLWLSAINLEYRDVGVAIPFLIQLGLFASPVIYPSSFVPERFQTLYGLINPMAGIIEGFRWSILGVNPPGYLLLASAAIIIFILVSGIYYFRRRERAFADII